MRSRGADQRGADQRGNGGAKAGAVLMSGDNGSRGVEERLKGQTMLLPPASLPLGSPAAKGLTAREAAQVLGYDNFMTVYNKVHQGAIKVRRRGRNILIWREDNEELFRARNA